MSIKCFFVLQLSFFAAISQKFVAADDEEQVFQCHGYHTTCEITLFSDKTPYKFSANDVSKVKVVNFRRTTVSSVPLGVFTAFPNVEQFTMSGLGVEDVTKEAFEGAINLENLRLTDNKIEALKAHTFQKASNIAILNLARNQLKLLEEETFKELTELKRIDLSQNALETLPARLFASNTNLEYLELEKNKLQDLDSKLLINCRVLQSILINQNELRKLVLDLSTNTLSYVNANNNQMTEVRLRALERTRREPNLNFHANHNQLGNTIRFENFDIRDLYLGVSRITDISDILKHTKLKLLNMGTNSIGNSTPDLSLDLFAEMKELRHLDLSYNGLKNLTITKTIPTISDLHLRGNQLRDLDVPSLTKNIPNLNYIGLTRNKWDCKTLDAMLDDLKAKRVYFYMFESHTTCYSDPCVKGHRCYHYETKAEQENDEFFGFTTTEESPSDDFYYTDLDYSSDVEVLEEAEEQLSGQMEVLATQTSSPRWANFIITVFIMVFIGAIVLVLAFLPNVRQRIRSNVERYRRFNDQSATATPDGDAPNQTMSFLSPV